MIDEMIDPSSLIFDREYYVNRGVSVPLDSLGKTQTVRSLFLIHVLREAIWFLSVRQAKFQIN